MDRVVLPRIKRSVITTVNQGYMTNPYTTIPPPIAVTVKNHPAIPTRRLILIRSSILKSIVGWID